MNKPLFATLQREVPIWEELCITYHDRTIDLHPRRNGPHAYFCSDFPDVHNECLGDVMQLFAAKYGHNVLNIYCIDLHKGPLYQKVHSLPHCCGIIAEEDKLLLMFHTLQQEIIRRQEILQRSGCDNAYRYIRTAAGKPEAEPMPVLLVCVAQFTEVLRNPVAKNYLPQLIAVSRCLGVHFVTSGQHDNLDEIHYYNMYQRFHFNKDEAGPTVVRTTVPVREKAPPINLQKYQSWDITAEDGQRKTLELICGDLCQCQQECDIVVCSAVKNDYSLVPDTLIHALARKCIFVDYEARRPELDLRTMGCWLSQETGLDYSRVACVELLDAYSIGDPDASEYILKKSFSTLRFLLEQAQIAGIPIETVALPILGTGYQSLELEYVLPPLITQCKRILTSNPGVKKLSFYEWDTEKYASACAILNQAFSDTAPKQMPRVFISYSSKQSDLAASVRHQLCRHGISCWMAPDSIPPGSNYLEQIALALSRIDVLVLILTPEATQSRWVQKEISTAIGANKIVLPYQAVFFDIDPTFRFLLDGEQILEAYQNPDPAHHRLTACVQRLLREEKGLIYKAGNTREEFSYDLLTTSPKYNQSTVFSMKQQKPLHIEDILNQTAPVADPAQEKLLRDIYLACASMQSQKLYWNLPDDEKGSKEDIRNDCIRNFLRARNYCVSDQSRSGVGSGGRRAGEVDMDIRLEPDAPWTIYEALNISGTADKSKWNEHLHKLLINYNPNGLPFLFLVSYLECSRKEFPHIADAFENHMQRHDPKDCERVRDSFSSLNEDHGQFIRMARCTYYCGVPITVYHLCVRLGD